MTSRSCQHVAGCITFPAHLDGSSPRRLYGGHQGMAASSGKLWSEVPPSGHNIIIIIIIVIIINSNNLLLTHKTPCEMMSRQRCTHTHMIWLIWIITTLVPGWFDDVHPFRGWHCDFRCTTTDGVPWAANRSDEKAQVLGKHRIFPFGEFYHGIELHNLWGFWTVTF